MNDEGTTLNDYWEILEAEREKDRLELEMVKKRLKKYFDGVNFTVKLNQFQNQG